MLTIRKTRGWSLCLLCLLVSACVGPPLIILPEELPNAIEGSPYSQMLTADADRMQFALADGSLPPGLRLDEDYGTLTGRPTLAGSYDFTVAVRGGGLPSRSGQRYYSLEVIEALTIDPDLEPARVNVPYNDAPKILGGVPPYTVDLVGLTGYLSYDRSTGRITGTLQPLGGGLEYEDLTLYWTVTDSGDPQQSETATSELEIHPIGVSITTEALVSAPVGEEYSVQLKAENGLQPYRWEVSDGVLPGSIDNDDRLRLNRSTGEIAGTPSPLATTSTFTVKVTDSDDPASSDTREFKLVIPVVLLTTFLPPATIGEPYEDDGEVMAAGAGLTPYAWALDEGDELPDGLTLDEDDGVIAGTPTVNARTQTFTVVLTDADTPPTQALQELKLVVGVAIQTESLPAASTGVAYAQRLTAAGGLGEYTWSVDANDPLPDWLDLIPATGELTGTPPGGATSVDFTIIVTDSDDPATTDERQLTIEIE